MYSVADLLPIDGLQPGTTLLLVGPPMTGKRSLATRLLTAGLTEGEAVALVSADESSRELRTSLAEEFGRDVDDYPIGIVDCAGETHEEEPHHPLDSRVGSPADLTGIGMELMTLLEELYTEHSQQIRVGLASLTTMSMYADPEQVVRFLHVLSNRISEIEGIGFVVAHSETVDDEQLNRFRSFVDGAVEIREGSETPTELRVVGLGAEPTDWVPVEQPSSSERRPVERTPANRSSVDIAPSLRAIADEVSEGGPTLTLLNTDDDDSEALSVIDGYFDRHNVSVRTATMDVETPRSVALLHRGDDLLASETVTALRNAIEIEVGDEVFASRRTDDLLSNLAGSVFGTGTTDKDLLVDVSHNIEMLAARTGRGRLHAGFQAFSRLVEDEQSLRIYRRLVERGIDVHVYGAPDADVPVDGLTLHAGENTEVTESWFVVFDGAGDPAQKAALLSFEQAEPNTYRGFWTYDSSIVDRIDDYLTATYVDGTGTEQISAE